MPAPVLNLKVAHRWLREFGAWGELEYSFSQGPKECSWQMTARYGSRLPVLRGGAFVEVYWGALRLWAGELIEPAWNGNEVALTANGLFRRGERWHALDSSGQPTSNARVAVDNAYSALNPIWFSTASIPNANLPGDPPQKVNSVSDVMNAWAEQLGQRWAVDQDGYVTMFAPPTVPSYLIRHGAGDLGIADDRYASHVTIWHTTLGGSLRMAAYPTPLRGGVPNAYERQYGHAERPYDITDRGPIADADADALAQAHYLQTTQRPGFTNGLTLGYGEILNTGWQPVHPALVRPNLRAHKLGTPDEVALTSYTPFDIAETSYRDGESTVDVKPVGLVSRTPEDLWTELLEERGVGE